MKLMSVIKTENEVRFGRLIHAFFIQPELAPVPASVLVPVLESRVAADL